MPVQGLIPHRLLCSTPPCARASLPAQPQQRSVRLIVCLSSAGRGPQRKGNKQIADGGASTVLFPGLPAKASRASSSDIASTSGGGSGDGTKDSRRGGGGGGGGEGSSGSSDEAKALLLGAGKSLESLPADFVEGLKAGKVSKDIAQRYLDLQNSLLSPLLNIGGFRERLLADPSFIVKLGIEVGIGIFTKSTAEYSKRGKHFWQEIDFVAANVAMALVADFMLVWLPAPRLALSKKVGGLPGSNSAIARFLANCPDNAFQRVRPGGPAFTLGQRSGAILRNGVKLLAVGFGSSVVGVGATQALSAVRTMLDPEFTTPNPPQNLLAVSAAYASYMGISSNLRYQIIAGVIEERGIEVFFKGSPQLCHVLSLIVRTGNTFAGSLLWIDYLRLLGMQPKGD